jgi:hypothetical protein
MELLGDMSQMEACFGLYGDSVNLGARSGAWFAPNVPWPCKSFWVHPMELLGNVGQVEARFGLYGDNGNLGTR